MSEYDRTPDAFSRRLAELIELAKARGYDGIVTRAAPATSRAMFEVKRGNTIVAAFGDLDMLERYLNLPW